MDKTHEQTFQRRGYTDDKWAHEKDIQDHSLLEKYKLQP